MAKIGFSHDM